MKAKLFTVIILVYAAASFAQENPLTANSRFLYSGARRLVLRSAEKTPEEFYGFKPVEGVRTFGQILGHAADSQYTFCSIALGEKNPAPQVEKNKKTKAELIAALNEAFAYCDKVYAGLTDASAAQMVKVFGADMPKLGVLTINSLHTTEHYGNLVTYMRMKNLVPPTSEPGGTAPPKN